MLLVSSIISYTSLLRCLVLPDAARNCAGSCRPWTEVQRTKIVTAVPYCMCYRAFMVLCYIDFVNKKRSIEDSYVSEQVNSSYSEAGLQSGTTRFKCHLRHQNYYFMINKGLCILGSHFQVSMGSFLSLRHNHHKIMADNYVPLI